MQISLQQAQQDQSHKPQLMTSVHHQQSMK